MVAVLDTHAVLWYLLDAKTLSPTAGSLIDEAATQGDPLYLSSISLVEVIYLVEKRRLPADTLERLLAEVNREHSTFRVIPLDSSIAETVNRIPRDIVPDMPDRIIAATALHLGLPLVTRDQRIQSAKITTIW